jgi:hypothetical protein
MPRKRGREWRYSSTILDLCTRWRIVVSFTPRPLYLKGESPRYPLGRRLGVPHSRYGRCEEKNLSPAGNRSPAVQPVAVVIPAVGCKFIDSFDSYVDGLIVEAVIPWMLSGPGSSLGQVMWNLWWTKWHWGRFSPSTSVSSANFHATGCFTLTICHPGLLQ